MSKRCVLDRANKATAFGRVPQRNEGMGRQLNSCSTAEHRKTDNRAALARQRKNSALYDGALRTACEMKRESSGFSGGVGSCNRILVKADGEIVVMSTSSLK